MSHILPSGPFALAAAMALAAPVAAEWKAAGDEVAAAARDPRIAAALAAVDRMDRAVIDDDHAAFAAMLADDLAVNNPQNGMSLHGATAQLNASGRIGYVSYVRRIEYAGLRGGMVLLMGEELVVPKPPNPMAGQQVRRRFTDVWKTERGRWLLTARQSTIVAAAR